MNNLNMKAENNARQAGRDYNENNNYATPIHTPQLRITINALLKLLDMEPNQEYSLKVYDPEYKIEYHNLNDEWKEYAQRCVFYENSFNNILNIENITTGMYKKTTLLNILHGKFKEYKNNEPNLILETIFSFLKEHLSTTLELHDDILIKLIIMYGVRECKILILPPDDYRMGGHDAN